MDKTICIFGASATWGAWDSEKGGWANRLRFFIESKHHDVFVYNLGVSGDTIKELLQRFGAEAEARQPNILIFSIGDNDSIYIQSQKKQRTPLLQFEKNLQKLIQKSRKFTDTIVFLGCKRVDEPKTTPIPWQTDYHYINKTLMEYSKIIKQVTKNNKCRYLDIFDVLQNGDFEDGLHPNSKGHQKIFLKVRDFLIKNNIL